MKGRRAADLVPWGLRALWGTLPFTLGPAAAAALDGVDVAVRTTASIQLWAGWGLAVAAVLVPHPVALTALRLLAPAAVAVAAATAAAGHGSPVGLAAALTSMGVALSAPVAARWVNGSAYPNERRFPLRAPGPLLFGPLVLVWAAVVAGVVAGPLLAADRRWWAAAAAIAGGWPLAWMLARALHNLARRWAVFVPAGFVLHDPVALVDPVLFARRHVASLGPAETGTDAVDLTQRAPGLALALSLEHPADLGLVTPGRRLGRTVAATAVLFTPARPGDVLDEARRRRLPVGTSPAAR